MQHMHAALLWRRRVSAASEVLPRSGDARQHRPLPLAIAGADVSWWCSCKRADGYGLLWQWWPASGEVASINGS
jgi:hypothetical protein